MSSNLGELFRDFSISKLNQSLERIAACTRMLSEEQIWARGRDSENAVANLLLHLNGNVRQWILSGVGGAADIRERDREFAARSQGASGALLEQLTATVREAVGVLRGLPDGRLTERITVQNYERTVLEAIGHVVEHFGQHTGQIIFITKMLTGEELGFYKHLKNPAHNEKVP